MDAPESPVPPAENAAYPTRRQRRVIWNALTALSALSLLAVAALTFYGFITFLAWSYPILLPIGLAVIIALVLDIPVTFLQKRGHNRETATLVVCLLAVKRLPDLQWAYLLPPLDEPDWRRFQAVVQMTDVDVHHAARARVRQQR